MGIKNNFLKFLKTEAPDDFVRQALLDTSIKRIALDTPIYINKYKAIYGDHEWHPHFSNFLQFFATNGIALWCIFDGKSPIEKLPENDARRRARWKNLQLIADIENALLVYTTTGFANPLLVTINRKFAPSFFITNTINVYNITEYINKLKKHSYRVDSADYEWVLHEILRNNFVCATAITEAEKYCVKLCKDNIVDAAMSDDSDLLGYRCPVICTKFSLPSQTCTIIRIDKLLQTLGLTDSEFLDFCIMCGTDYNKNCLGIATQKAYNYIRKYKTIEQFAQETHVDISCLNHIKVRELYSFR